MKPNHFILSVALCATILSLSCQKECAEVEKDTESNIFFIMIDKITRKNLLDYSVGDWTDSVRIYDIQRKKIVSARPNPDGSMSFTFFDENSDNEAFNKILNKKFIINLQHDKDTFELDFKMKTTCNVEVESMDITYQNNIYKHRLRNETFTFVKP